MKKGILNLGLFIVFFSCSSVFGINLTGSVKKNNVNETLTFDLKIGDDSFHYKVQGSTSTSKGWYQSNLDYSYITVMKKMWTDDGRLLTKSFLNKGVLEVFPRVRQMQSGMVLAGIPVEGQFLQGYIDDGLWLSGLTVNHVSSKGCIDYNSLNGHYNFKSTCQFGICAVRSSEDGKCVFDYDTAIFNENAMVVSMVFDEVSLKGRINFTDTKQTNISQVDEEVDIYDENGNKTGTTTISKTKTNTTVTATEGQFNITLLQTDGTEPRLLKLISKDIEESEVSGGIQSDDLVMRQLIAFIELMTYDMFSE